METFVDKGREGGITVVLGGKVLVVDVDLSVDKTDALQPKVKVSNVKTSYAVSNAVSGATTSAGNSTSLDALLYGTIEKFYVEVQKAEDIRNSEEAARFGANTLEQLHYLVMLDRLAARKEDGGLRWFADIDQLCPILEGFAKSEGGVVASYVLFSQSLYPMLMRAQIVGRHACTTRHISPTLSCVAPSLSDFSLYIILDLHVAACIFVPSQTEHRAILIPRKPAFASIRHFTNRSSFLAYPSPERCHCG